MLILRCGLVVGGHLKIATGNPFVEMPSVGVDLSNNCCCAFTDGQDVALTDVHEVAVTDLEPGFFELPEDRVGIGTTFVQVVILNLYQRHIDPLGEVRPKSRQRKVGMPFHVKPQPHTAVSDLRLGLKVFLSAYEGRNVGLAETDSMALLYRGDSRNSAKI